ncbi:MULTISPECIES: DUF2314 domain-containing protein [unclassified Modicisalibacter]|uniref:YegJ family protein n=1 Tax=unclassified Modicisalibacter TaxID=2679913 RepID=UPI001CCAEDC7|nr:DUF2314 domain-containing protein [Modicisalibacter sp. R2A 31.J]MBZ9575178.1 DUF2314 domain-containing protein [Modicisalibacter sp. MOD 31.J]
MIRIILLCCLVLFSATAWAEERGRSEVIEVPRNDVEMNKAIQKARESLDVFVERLKSPQDGDSNFTLKVAVTDEQGTEHFWVSDISLTSSGFEGVIANEAEVVKAVSLGQKVSFDADVVSDWSFEHNGVKQGAFTLRVLLERMPEEQAEYYKQVVGWD